MSPLEFKEFDSSEYLLFFIASLMFGEFSLKCWLFAITFTLVYCLFDQIVLSSGFLILFLS